MAPVRVTARSMLEEIPSAPLDLPVDDHGKPLPLEIGMLLHFRESNDRGGPAASAEAPIKGDARPRIILPSLREGRDAVEMITDALVIDARSPARYFRCKTEFDLPYALETRFVYRRGARHVTFASYLLRTPDSDEVAYPFICYHFSTAPSEGRSVLATIKAIARREVDQLMQIVRGRPRARFGDVLPLLRSTTTELGGGAMTWSVDPKNGETTITIRRPKIETLGRREKKRVQDELRTLARSVRLPSGDVPAYDSDEIRKALAELAPICDDLLREVRDADWPPFRSHRAIDRFVQERFSGDREVVEALADVLKSQERRPSNGRDLAVRVLAGTTGLSRDRVRRLSRV